MAKTNCVTNAIIVGVKTGGKQKNRKKNGDRDYVITLGKVTVKGETSTVILQNSRSLYEFLAQGKSSAKAALE